MPEVKLLRLLRAARVPTKGTEGSAYWDLYSAVDIDVLPFSLPEAVSTGWDIEVPVGYFLDVRPRSGLALKGVTVNNSPGTVDADYRGELKIILVNHSREKYSVHEGDRIAQCALMPVIECTFRETLLLSTTFRGRRGYGSTGR